MIYDKIQIVRLFNNYFVNIVDNVPEITEQQYGRIKAKISLLPSDPHISLDGHSIERVNSYKCLGVQVDETLSWEAHISEVIGKVAKVLALCPEETKTNMSSEYPCHYLQVIDSSATRLLLRCLGLYR